MINHQKDAETILKRIGPSMRDLSVSDALAFGQIAATLALVQAQATANEIAVSRLRLAEVTVEEMVTNHRG